MKVLKTVIHLQQSNKGQNVKNREGEIKRGLNKTHKLKRAQKDTLDMFTYVLKQDKRAQRNSKKYAAKYAKRK